MPQDFQSSTISSNGEMGGEGEGDYSLLHAWLVRSGEAVERRNARRREEKQRRRRTA